MGLAVALARRHPRFDVELLHLPLAEVAGAHVDHPVGQFELLHEVLGVPQDLLVKGDARGLVVLADDDLLDLVEQVDAVQAVGVLARGAGLPAEARALGHVLAGQVGLVEDLVPVIGGQRHLGRAHQAHLVALAPVGLLLAARVVTGADHHGVADEHGDGHGLIATLDHHVDGQTQHGLVQQRAVTLEQVVAGARQLDAALHIDDA